jgi:mRNA interferase MazF
VNRGDVFMAELRPRSGSEQSGTRPVIVISHNAFNQTPGWRSIIVVPLSTSINQARRGLTAIPIFAGEAGLSRDSVALCHQVTTLDRSKLKQRIGHLTDEQMLPIANGLKAAMDLV